jgi:hypothetical protein
MVRMIFHARLFVWRVASGALSFNVVRQSILAAVMALRATKGDEDWRFAPPRAMKTGAFSKLTLA